MEFKKGKAVESRARVGRLGHAEKSRKASARKRNGSTTSHLRQIALGDLSENLGYRIRRAQLWIFKDVNRKLAAFDLGPAKFSVLTVIDANPGINQLAVASVLSIERAGLGRLVDRLEQQGLVARTASLTNRRYYVLHLTTKGATLLKRIRPVVALHEKALAEKFGPRVYKDLLRTLSIFLYELL